MSISRLSNEQLIFQIETCSLSANLFDHYAHLQLGWAYLQRFSFDVACSKVSKALSTYAAHLGAHEKYHHTLTIAFMCLIYERAIGESTFEAFIHEHSELVHDAKSLLSIHYSDDMLFSALAKKKYVEPDRQHWLIKKADR